MPDAEKRFPHFAVNCDSLYQITKMFSEVTEQLLVTQPYMQMVLNLAHSDALGGHLGAEKMEAQITLVADNAYFTGQG